MWGRMRSYNGVVLVWNSQALFSKKKSAAVKRIKSFLKDFFLSAFYNFISVLFVRRRRLGNVSVIALKVVSLESLTVLLQI